MNELEKAAREYSFCHTEEDECLVAIKLKEAFAMGAQWQKEQSPWISVEERLPEEDGLRVWVKSSCLNHQPLIHHDGKFYARLSDGAYDGSVTHWMYIPEV